MLLTAIVSAVILVSPSGCGAAETSDVVANMAKGAANSAKIDWYRNVDEATTAAKSRDTIIMVDVFTDWCHWCKELDKNVFTDQRVIDLSAKIVNLKVNAEDNGQGTALAKKFGVNGYPTILFITADGQEVDRIGGYLPPEDFAETMGGILGGKSYLGYSKALDDGTLAAADSVDALAKFMNRQDQARVKKVAEGLDPADVNDMDSREKAYRLLTDYNLSNNNFAKAENLLVDYVGAYPESEMLPRAYLIIVVANLRQNDMADAKKYVELIKQKFPEEKEIIAQAEQMLSQAS